MKITHILTTAVVLGLAGLAPATPCVAQEDETIFLYKDGAGKCAATLNNDTVDKKPNHPAIWKVYNRCGSDQEVWLDKWAKKDAECSSGAATHGHPLVNTSCGHVKVEDGRRAFMVCKIRNSTRGCWKYNVYLCDPSKADCKPAIDPQIEVHRDDFEFSFEEFLEWLKSRRSPNRDKPGARPRPSPPAKP